MVYMVSLPEMVHHCKMYRHKPPLDMHVDLIIWIWQLCDSDDGDKIVRISEYASVNMNVRKLKSCVEKVMKKSEETLNCVGKKWKMEVSLCVNLNYLLVNTKVSSSTNCVSVNKLWE